MCNAFTTFRPLCPMSPGEIEWTSEQMLEQRQARWQIEQGRVLRMGKCDMGAPVNGPAEAENFKHWLYTFFTHSAMSRGSTRRVSLAWWQPGQLTLMLKKCRCSCKSSRRPRQLALKRCSCRSSRRPRQLMLKRCSCISSRRTEKCLDDVCQQENQCNWNPSTFGMVAEIGFDYVFNMRGVCL